jgi:hypothetical protein
MKEIPSKKLIEEQPAEFIIKRLMKHCNSLREENILLKAKLLKLQEILEPSGN